MISVRAGKQSFRGTRDQAEAWSGDRAVTIPEFAITTAALMTECGDEEATVDFPQHS